MARPNSKYFSSVISKLIAAKRQEHIVIDQNFKVQLREQLVRRVSGPVLEKEAFDWGEFFSRWKYPLTLVPSALLLMLVVSAVTKLPVVMPSEVAVPLVSSQQESLGTEVSGKSATTPTEDVTSLQSSVLTQGETEKPRIKTFPGALVMPKKVPATREPVLTVAPPTLMTDEPVLESVSVPEVPVSPTASETLAKTVVDGLMPLVTTVVPDRTEEGGTSDTTTSHKETKMTDVPTAPETSTDTATDTAAKVVETKLPETPLSGEVQTQPVPATVDTVLPSYPTPVSAPTETPTSAVTVSPSLETVEPALTINKIPAVQEQPTRSFPVFYQFDMSEADRSGFEKAVLPVSIDSKEVSHVVVLQKEGGIIELQVFFSDSTSSTTHYKKNTKTGAWDTVEYVTRYYYDNSLQYTTDVRYLVPNR